MTKLNAAKSVARFVVGGSVSFTVANALRNNTSPTTTIQKLEVVVGSVVVGMMVAKKAEAFTDNQIDEAANWWNENVKKTSK